jgi:argininosuccinate synthase
LKLSRQEEVDYLSKKTVHYSWKKQYSINKGLWGTSVGGKETLTSNQPLPNDAYHSLQRREEKVTLTFEKEVEINNIKKSPIDICYS